METSLRLRLIFENGEQIFTKTQLKLGLNKSLIFLQPHQQNLHTIADLSAYIIKSYNLEQSCPRGLVLTIDGFALPPFETISLLKDQDIISVKKRGRSVLKIKGSDGTNNVEQKDPTTSRIFLLADKEFEKDQSANSEEEEEGEIFVSKKKKSDSKKREGPEKSSSPKKKKQRGGEGPTIEKKKEVKKVTDSSESDSSESDEESTPRKKKELKEDNEDTPVSVSIKKGPSRSARRKKASRKWKSAMNKIRFNAPDLSLKDGEIWTQANAIAKKVNQSKDRKGKRELVESEPKGLIHLFDGNSSRKGQNGNNENEVYPKLVRPGHIRFEPLDDDEDETEKRSEIPVGTYQWNGITSKKQGQKWGTNDKNTLQRGQCSVFRNNGKNTRQTGQYSSNYSYTKGDFMTIDDNTLPNTQNGDIITQVNELLLDSTNVDKNTTLVVDSMNVDKNTPQKVQKVSIEFEKLPPLSIPKEGDVIAYRLLELSTSWTPEMTEFRVGKIAWYNANTSQIRLSPVEEYPINFGENDESKDNSNYCEDGSLQIDFKALMNVRLLNNDEVVNASLTSQSVVNDQNGVSPVGPTINNSQTNLTTQESGVDNQEKSALTPGTEKGVNPWEQFSEALNSKKEELTSNGWGEPKKKDDTPPKINGWDEPNLNINYGPPGPSGGSYGRGPGGGYGRGPGRGRGFGPRGGGNNNGRGAGTFRGAWRGGAMGPTMARLRSEYKG